MARHSLLIALLLSPGLPPGLSAAEAPVGTEASTTTSVADPFTGLTPAQATAAQTTVDKIKAEQDIIFPGGVAEGELYKKIQADMAADRITYFDRVNEWNGTDQARTVAGSPIDGGFLLKGQLQRNQRNFRDTRYLGSAGTFSIIDSNSNILADQNSRLNSIANSISRSRFACGQFDWVMQLRGKFNKAALTKYVDKLAESALAAAPMALLANLSPTLYEIVKFLRMTASMELDADKIQCSQMESAFTDIGRRTMRGDGYADCLKANQGLGVTEAARICNQDQSPFDGVENASGQIVGFTGGTNPPNGLNLTRFLADKIDTGKPSEAATDLATKKQVTDQLAAASAALSAAPDPGDADPAWAEGSVEKTTWQKKKNAYVSAKRNYSDASDAVAGAYGSSNNEGVWSTLRNSLADNLGSIIGDIDLGLKANVAFGNQDQYKLVLEYKHQAFLLAQGLAEQLEIHFDAIEAVSQDPDRIKASYYQVLAFCWKTSQAPWQILPPFPVNNHRSTDVIFSYSTIDKMAVLWTMNRRGAPDSLARTDWAITYNISECINQLTMYEVYQYLYEHEQRDRGKVLAEAQKMMTQDGADKIILAIKDQLDSYEKLLTEKRDALLPELAKFIDDVNSFDLRRATLPFEPANRVSPIVPNNFQNLGR